MRFEMPHKGLSELTSKMPYKFILEHLKIHSTHFDLFLVDGRGNELNIGKQRIREVKRLFDSREDIHTDFKESTFVWTKIGKYIFRGERCLLARMQLRIVQMNGLPPLLLLYKVLARDHKNEKQVYGSYWAWSLIIPGDRSKQQKKMVFGNSVLLRQLSQEEGFER